MTFPFPLFRLSLLKVSFYIAIIFIIVFIYNNIYIPYKNKENKYLYGEYSEGFSQDRPFILKENNAIYDDFYIDIYDKLTNTKERVKEDIERIREVANLDKETTKILDVGCGTGELLTQMYQGGAGGIAIGVDKSSAMIQYCKTNHPSPLGKVEFLLKNVEEDPEIFERATFSHILCLYMTIYEIEKKTQFFRNCHYGLQAGGFLILHLINPKKQNIKNGIEMIDLGKPKSLTENQIMNSNIKNIMIDFGSFKYKRDWDDSNVLKETFIDNTTQSVRQNELNWKIEPIDTIVEQCAKCGLSLYTFRPLGEKVDGFLYFFIKRGVYTKVDVVVSPPQ